MSAWGKALPPSQWLKVQPGDTVELDLHGFRVQPSKFQNPDGSYDDVVVASVTVTGQPTVKHWQPNVGAVRALDEANAPDYGRVRLARDADTQSGGRTRSNWTVVVLGGGSSDLPVDDSGLPPTPAEPTIQDRAAETFGDKSPF